MRPGEADDGCVAVVDELDGPAALVLDPYEDDAGGVAGGQLLIGLVPAHKRHLRTKASHFFCGHFKITHPTETLHSNDAKQGIEEACFVTSSFIV